MANLKNFLARSVFFAVAAGAGALFGEARASGCLELETEHVSLILQRTDDDTGWDIVHLGAKAGDVASVQNLSDWHTRVAHHAQRRPTTCSALGETGISQFNAYGGLAVAHADGGLSTRLRGESAAFLPDADGARHLVLSLVDVAHPFRVRQHFRALAACDVIETWMELENGEDGPVRLSRMDSFAVDFPVLADTYHVHHLAGQWGAECQLVENEVRRGETVTFGSRSGVRDAFEASAGVMISIGERATETAGTVFGGVLCWSGIWGISVQRGPTDALLVRAGVDNAFGAYVLDRGRRIALPKFAFTWSAYGKGGISRNIHRWARDWQMPNGRKIRPILLNSWEGSYFTFTEKTLHGMMDGVRDLGGEMFVLDDGWFGRGRHARDEKNEDRAGLGDWTCNPEKLPHGLAGLSEEAARRGLKFGLWVEPEMVNTNSWMYESHPDWVLAEKGRPLAVGRGGSQTVLDFVNSDVRDGVFRQLDALYEGIPLLSYVKWDANADFMNLGSPSLDAAHQANFPFDYTMGLYELLGRLRKKHPAVDMQACASGGGRADYGFLRYADEFWGSDISDARERVFIQWGESLFFPANAIAAHVTDVPNHQTGRVTPLKFRFDVAMSARFGFELQPKKMSQREIAFARGCVADYKRIRPVVQQGDLYRLVSPYGHGHAALMYVNADKSRAVVFLYGLARSVLRDFTPPLKLQGLSATCRYRINEINRAEARAHSRSVGKIATGLALAEIGLPVSLKGDYDSAVFELASVKEEASITINNHSN